MNIINEIIRKVQARKTRKLLDLAREQLENMTPEEVQERNRIARINFDELEDRK